VLDRIVQEIALFGSRFTSRIGAIVVMAVACARPRIEALPGAAAPSRRLPPSPVLTGHRKIVFQWELKDQDMTARGDGVARIAYPDSVRLDFFLGGSYAGGAAVVDRGLAPGAGPGCDPPPRCHPAPCCGRHLVVSMYLRERDTVVRVDGPIVRADIGSPVHWRVSYRADSLSRLERVSGGRIHEWVERGSDQHIQYRHEASGRTLSLVIQRSDAVSAFDPSIWHL
jgi:hypothetical protein